MKFVIPKKCGPAALKMVGQQGTGSFTCLSMNEIYYPKKMWTCNSTNGVAIGNSFLNVFSYK